VISRLLLLLVVAPLVLAASAPVGAGEETLDQALAQARAEAKSAEAQAERLEQAAGRARDEAGRLAAERQAAAAAIAAAEARISAADTQVKLTEARVANRAERLAQKQAPVASLLAGIVAMGRRPPLLSIADQSSLDEFVRVRALLDTTLPVIRARSAALSAELAESRRLEGQARSARDQLASAGDVLREKQERFAALEQKAIERAVRLGASAVGAGDVMIARGESASLLGNERQLQRAERALARELAAFPPAPPRPGATRTERPPIAYQLPVAAAVSIGLGSVSASGIRARGVTLASDAGIEVAVPADGTIAFAGPFRRHDGVVIIDHGDGWMSLLTGVRTNLPKGARVRRGQPLGRALGPISVELSTNGRPVSAALIAGSSELVSNMAKGG
jgi:murein hydrolase activator